MLQTKLDRFFREITSKQFFLLICLNLFSEHDPSVSELAEVMQSSHQNVKQLAIKLEKAGFIRTYADSTDRRILRVASTQGKKYPDKKYSTSCRKAIETIFRGIDDSTIACVLQAVLKIEQNLMNTAPQEPTV
jgi:DNA-binding MarR family transcriptional regulator